MRETATVCAQCGYDFPPPAARPWWRRQSTLRGWLTLMAVLGIPLAFLHYASQTTRPLVIPLGLGACCLLCAWLLGKSSLWTTIFEMLALVCLLVVCVLSF